MKESFVPALHAFRAFAILNIVAIHAFEFIFYYADTFESTPSQGLGYLQWADGILLHDSTLYFTFISGILFSMVLADRGYKQFFKSKLTNVVLPYLIFTILFTWRSWNIEGFVEIFDGSTSEFVVAVGHSLISGSAIFTFWYIPVLMVLYLATPALARLLALPKASWLNLIIMFSPLVLSRIRPDTSWTTFAYFLGAYMLGLYAGANYQKLMKVVGRYAVVLTVIALTSTAVLVILFALEAPVWKGIVLTESAWYIQKIAFSALVLLLFERTITRVPKWMDLLGNYAFTIYFLHGYLLFEMYEVMAGTGVLVDSIPMILVFSVLNLAVVILVSILITYIVKLTTGRWSRCLIGS